MTKQKNKLKVAIWEYRNSDEDFDRLIVISLEGLQEQIDAGTLSKEDVPKVVYGMEGMFNALKSCYNLYPKSPEFENKKPNDFKLLENNKLFDAVDKVTFLKYT